MTIPATITPLAQDVLRRAADWLEANPDKHITGDMARTDEGWATEPLKPHATCFCALGRIAVEAQIDVWGMAQVGDWLTDNGVVENNAADLSDPLYDRIWILNDSLASQDPNPDVIPALRRLADGDFGGFA